MKSPPTDRQQAILAFIAARIRDGAAPTRGEIAERFGFASRSAAEQHLRALAAKGLIRLQAGSARGIRLPDSGRGRAAEAANVLLPLIGRVAAGSPLLADAHVERQVAVAADLFRPRADYLLRVVGESMREIGIVDGDWLAVHRQASAEHGQIVVARIDEEVTVKRLHQQRGRILLLPANADFAPIPVDPSRAFAIEGLAVGVLRTRLGA
ncbi:MAG: transcriptional repressor LexA [Lysobacterales bacterium]